MLTIWHFIKHYHVSLDDHSMDVIFHARIHMFSSKEIFVTPELFTRRAVARPSISPTGLLCQVQDTPPRAFKLMGKKVIIP